MCEKQIEVFTTSNKAYADRFIIENYKNLHVKFRAIDGKINGKCNSSLDKLNDTMLSLYREIRLFDDYESFEAFAIGKFTEP